MKLGEHKKLLNNGYVKELWLTKWKPTKEYQIWGLVSDGWAVLFSGTLKQAREYAKHWN